MDFAALDVDEKAARKYNKALLNGSSPLAIELTIAVKAGDVDKVKAMDKFSIELDGMYGLYASLKLAFEHGAPMVEAILDSPIDINHVHALDKMTPIQTAVYLERMECVKVLMEHGADPEIMVSGHNGNNAITCSAYLSNDDILEYLISEGCNVNSTNNEQNNTPLILASSGGRVSTVRLLLENGADHLIQNAKGMRAYDYAIDNGHPEVIEILDHHIAKVMAKKEHEDLMLAASKIVAINEINDHELIAKSKRMRI